MASENVAEIVIVGANFIALGMAFVARDECKLEKGITKLTARGHTGQRHANCPEWQESHQATVAIVSNRGVMPP